MYIRFQKVSHLGTGIEVGKLLLLLFFVVRLCSEAERGELLHGFFPDMSYEQLGVEYQSLRFNSRVFEEETTQEEERRVLTEKVNPSTLGHFFVAK